jgi:hypothetical protein
MDGSVERLARLIRENQPCVVLTGAGVSTESVGTDLGPRASSEVIHFAMSSGLDSSPARLSAMTVFGL